tara:strand:- start:186 stop:974 length:789 start_codon:yes stop_codon:yes gene_type:complete
LKLTQITFKWRKIIMAINLEKMKEKYRALQQKGNGERNLFWKPQDGEQTIRIVPDPDGDPFKEYWFHYNVGNENGFLCPKRMHGDDCPVCEFVSKLYNTKDEEDRKMASNMRAKQRFFSPVVIRGEEDKGVRLWGYSKTVYERLLSLVLNPDYGDITDPEDGTDMVIDYGKKSGQLYPSTDVQPRRKSSALAKDKSQSREFMDSKIDYNSLFNSKTQEEIGNALEVHCNGVSDTEKPDVQSYKAAGTSNEVEASFKQLLAAG